MDQSADKVVTAVQTPAAQTTDTQRFSSWSSNSDNTNSADEATVRKEIDPEDATAV